MAGQSGNGPSVGLEGEKIFRSREQDVPSLGAPKDHEEVSPGTFLGRRKNALRCEYPAPHVLMIATKV